MIMKKDCDNEKDCDKKEKIKKITLHKQDDRGTRQ